MQSYPRFPMPVELMGRDPSQWSRREARSYLSWVQNILEDRVTGLLRFFEEDTSGPPEQLLERMGAHIARVLPLDAYSHEPQHGVTIIEKGGRKLALPHPEGRTLTAEGYALAMDTGLLLAKLVLARGEPEYRWDVGPRPKSHISYNHPVLRRIDGRELNPFDPMGSSVVSAFAILRGTHGAEQWRIVYEATANADD